MTAQVTILNKLGVAIASDSSVTLSAPGGKQRSFPTADKVYPLPGVHASAVLHSGNTEFLGVPYIVLLGEWFRTLPDRRLDRVGDYSVRFSAWLTEQRGLFSPDIQDGYLGGMWREYFMSIRSELLDRCNERGVEAEDWKHPAAAGIVSEVMEGRLQELKGHGSLSGWVGVDFKSLVTAHMAAYSGALEWVFDDTPRTAEGDAILEDIAAELLRVEEPWSDDATLVFTGFGESEMFPAQQSVVYHGILDGRLRAESEQYTVVTVQDGATISPLGQTEAINFCFS